MSEENLRHESFALKVSFVLSIVYVFADLAIAIICDSCTILLDGLYGIADIVVSFFAILAVSKINQPPNEKYHFGYAKYEPFMTALEGILITAVCLSTVALSIQDIAHPEPVKHPNLIIWYSFINIFISFGIGLYERPIGKRTGSEIVKADSELWIICGFISMAVFVAFYISNFLTSLGLKWYADYVDPVMSILLALFFLKRPSEILKESFLDLVDASPRKEIKLEVKKAVDSCVERYLLKGIKWIKLRKAGRKIFISVCFHTESHKSLSEIAAIKEKIVSEISRLDQNFDVAVFFEA